MSARALRRIEREAPGCMRCPRLARHLRAVRRRHADYWGRPVPGFGDARARLVVVGLAPGMHGANRTGTPFRGDASGGWLYRALRERGFWDGRRLHGAYVTNAVKCHPPGNQPKASERDRCGECWLEAELEALARARVVVALGGVAHRAVLDAFGARPLSRHPFEHGALARIAGRPPLLASYHPSRQNTNTGRLTWPMWTRVWRRAARLAGEARARG